MANHNCNKKSPYADLGHGKHKIDNNFGEAKKSTINPVNPDGNDAVCMDNMLSMSLIENDVCAG